jgi:hypothetical protein
VEVQDVLDNMVSWTKTDVQHGVHFVHLNAKVFPNDEFSRLTFKVVIWLTLVLSNTSILRLVP